MADLSTKQRKALPSNAFAVPSKAPGSGSFPIPDKAHARNALARASGKPVEAKVKAAVHRKFPDIGKPSHSGSSGLDHAMGAHADSVHPHGAKR